MIDIPEGYVMGRAERGYLVKLEDFRKAKVPLTPSDFAKKVGRDVTSFKRYSVLKQALNEYGWQSKPDQMRGPRPDLLKKISLAQDPAIARLEAEVDRLRSKLGEIDRLKGVVAERDEEIAALRGLVMATVTHFSANDMSRAAKIERKLATLVRERLSGLGYEIPDLGGGGSVTDINSRRR